MALPKVGVEAVIENLGNFENGSRTVVRAFSQMDAGADNVASKSGGLSKQLTGLGSTILKLGGIAATVAAGGLAALGAGLTGFAVGGISKATDLDQQLSNIAATMNKTKGEVIPLKDLIFDLSLNPKLTVDANQAADAIELLARNGLEMTEIIDGAAEATVALANATGADFGLAADIATDVMALFNIEAKDMGSAIDAITGVTTNSKFTIDDFRLALAQSGGVAAGIGVSLEDLTTVLAATSSAFASGSDAGTSFRNFLQRLANPTKENQELISQLGLSLFDTEGNMRDIGDVAQQLNDAFSGMTEAQKAETAAQLGGADASRTVLELAKLTTEEFAALREEVNAEGQAFQAAATRVDSLKGALAILRGIVEAIQIQVGDKFLPILRQMTSSFADFASRIGPSVVDFFGRIADGIGLLIDQFSSGFIGNFGNDFGVFGQILAGVEEVLDNFLPEDVMSRIFDFHDALGILFNTISGDLLGGVGSLSDVFKNNLGPAIDFIANTILPALTQAVIFVNDHFEEIKGAVIAVSAVLAGAAIIAAISAIGAAIAALATPITAIIAAAALIGAAWAGNWFGIRDITADVIDFIEDAVDDIVKFFKPIFKKVGPDLLELWEIIGEKTEEIWPLIQEIVEDVMEAIQDIISTITRAIERIWGRHGDEMKSIWSGVWDNIFKILKTTISNILDLIKLSLQIMTGDWDAAGKTLQDITKRTWDAIKDSISTVLNAINSIVKSVMASIESTIESAWSSIESAIESAINSIQSAVSSGFNAIRSIISSVMNSIQSSVSSAFNDIRSTIQSIMSSIQSTISSTWNNVVNTIRSRAQEAVSVVQSTLSQLPGIVSGLASQLFNAAVSMMQGLINGILNRAQEITNTLVTSVTNAVNSMVSAVTSGSLATSLLNAGRSILNRVIDGIRTVTNMGTELITRVTQAVSSLVTQVSSGAIFSNLFNAGREIMQGIIDGIRSNAQAVVDTVIDIIDEFIDEIYNFFGITSPSKLMAAIGQNIMAGLQQGLASMTPAINAQFAASIAAPVASVAGPLLGSGSSTVINNNYNLGGNTISTGIDGATFEARVLRVIKNNFG